MICARSLHRDYERTIRRKLGYSIEMFEVQRDDLPEVTELPLPPEEQVKLHLFGLFHFSLAMSWVAFQ